VTVPVLAAALSATSELTGSCRVEAVRTRNRPDPGADQTDALRLRSPQDQTTQLPRRSP
jgi:hypothetical protein